MSCNVFPTKLIAFYLPQYHPIPENDEWWGKGFTEWTNVTKARPLFPGHYQPHLPADLGFYDLRVPETREAQADLAREYGIYGFCYYHYWFNGKRLLERPFEEVLASGKPEFPFCLCWANETWSRRWLGEETSILQKQTYSLEDDFNHINWLIKAFKDPRYIKIDGKPAFLIYRPRDLPDPEKTTAIFRQECIKNGLNEPYLIGVDAHCPGFNCKTIGFDSTLNFEPQLSVLPDFKEDRPQFSKLIRNFQLKGIINPKLKLYDDSAFRQLMKKKKPPFLTYPCVCVSWDNTPRRGEDAIVVTNSSPKILEGELLHVLQNPANYEQEAKDTSIVFINAWNEWAEGNHLEPDQKYQRQYLEAVKRSLEKAN